MSNNNELAIINDNFSSIYNRAHRLTTAVFVVSNLMEDKDELKTKIRNLSLKLVSDSISLRDSNFVNTAKTLSNMEKGCLELMSLLDIASVIGLISKMNASVIKEEFDIFVSELRKFSGKFEEDKNISIQSFFAEEHALVDNSIQVKHQDSLTVENRNNQKINKIESPKISINNRPQNGNGSKRKDLRKNMILEFIKGHNDASIKDIIPNINGCSEKTVQRELINLINEGKIKKIGERRWSKYSTV